MQCTIKLMETDEERSGKARVHWQSWHEAYQGILDSAVLESVTPELCERIAAKERGTVLVAKDGERVIGFCNFGTYRGNDLVDAGEIYAIYLLAEYYGQGIGRSLMQAALDDLDYPTIAVWVLTGNARAIGFYEKNGFSFEARREENIFGVPTSELRLVRKRRV